MAEKTRRNLKSNRSEPKKEIKINYKRLTLVIAICVVVIISGVVVFNLVKGKGVSGKKLVKGQKLEVVDTNLEFKDGVTQVKATVKNKSNAKKENVSLKITFIGETDETIAIMRGYVGDIEKGKTANIKAAITKDVTKAKDVKYEIIEE